MSTRDDGLTPADVDDVVADLEEHIVLLQHQLVAAVRERDEARALVPAEGTPATLAASALATAMLAPGNAGISIFAAHGDDAAPPRWTVVWAKGAEADRLRAWLGDDDQEDPDDAG